MLKLARLPPLPRRFDRGDHEAAVAGTRRRARQDIHPRSQGEPETQQTLRHTPRVLTVKHPFSQMEIGFWEMFPYK